MQKQDKSYLDNQDLQKKCGIVAFYGFKFEKKLPVILHAAGNI